ALRPRDQQGPQGRPGRARPETSGRTEAALSDVATPEVLSRAAPADSKPLLRTSGTFHGHLRELREEVHADPGRARMPELRGAGGDRAFAREGAPRGARAVAAARSRSARSAGPRRAVEGRRPGRRGRARRAARAPPPSRAAREEADRRADR